MLERKDAGNPSIIIKTETEHQIRREEGFLSAVMR